MYCSLGSSGQIQQYLTLESTHKIQTDAKTYVLVRNVKLVHTTEIKLITKIVNIMALTPSKQ